MADKGCREASYWGLHVFIFLFIIEQRKSGLRSQSKRTSESGCRDAMV